MKSTITHTKNKIFNLMPANEALKIIALITMTIDHIDKFYLGNTNPSGVLSDIIGRAAFPIFAYLISLNLLNGVNHKKYLPRLLFFGIIAIPFIYYADKDYSSLNIMFTLALSVAIISFAEPLKKIFHELSDNVFYILYTITLLPITLIVAYSLFGVFYICSFYWWMKSKSTPALTCLLILSIAINSYSYLPAIMGFLYTVLLIIGAEKYSKKRILKPWWLFYAYYPVHILVIALCANFL
ncbi:MAG: hypothetical protein GY804_12350 [Alphaproteobacteria bacterium]|nr:hypothetical protein [Alphaproteobacteria bacterium]